MHGRIMMQVRKVTQLSVHLENRVGALADVCNLIAKHSINLFAICAIDTVEEAVVRLVAENPEVACTLLTDHGFRPLETDVLLLELGNEPGATGRVASKLSEAGINIDYIYASAHQESGKALLVLRTQQVQEAISLLSEE